MTDFCEIQWTAGSIDEGRKVARYLVQERYVACAQIIPWIESIYMWNNQLETTQETKIILKSPKSNYKQIEEIIKKNSSYELPEITWKEIEGGSEEYLAWLSEVSHSR